MGIGNSLTPPTEGTVSIRWPPRVMITDKLASYGAAKREVMPGIEHRQHKGLNNRAVNSHQPTRRRERLDLLKLLSGVLVGLFRSHAAREAETAFLRQQLVVLKRSAPARLRLRTADRLIFVWLYRLCLLCAKPRLSSSLRRRCA